MAQLGFYRIPVFRVWGIRHRSCWRTNRRSEKLRSTPREFLDPLDPWAVTVTATGDNGNRSWSWRAPLLRSCELDETRKTPRKTLAINVYKWILYIILYYIIFYYIYIILYIIYILYIYMYICDHIWESIISSDGNDTTASKPIGHDWPLSRTKSRFTPVQGFFKVHPSSLTR